MEEQKNQENTESNGNGEDNKNSAPVKRKSIFKRFILFNAAALTVWWFNNFTIKTAMHTVYSEKVDSPVRIAVISDQHASEHSIDNEKIIKKIDSAEPDIVFILGDMYSRDGEAEEREIPVQLAKMISENGYPLYFVPGEHDTSQEYIDMIAEAGAAVMDYRSEYIEVNGNRLQILGIDNVYYSPTFDLNNAFVLDKSCYSILMAHIPNYESFADFGADLTLCGDTHGGIIQLPFGKGPAYYSETGEWFPEIRSVRSDIYDKGLFPYENGIMFITSGLGAYPYPARLNNRPEVAVIDIMPEK